MGIKRIRRVYTFYETRENRVPRVSAYTLWADPSWVGCKVYDVEADSGTEAKKIAIKMRKEDEAKEKAASVN